MSIWTTLPTACTNRGVHASVCAFLCVCARVLTAECRIVRLESHSHILLHIKAHIFISLKTMGQFEVICFGHSWIKENDF